MSTVGVCGQTEKELLKLRRENDDQEACNQANRMKNDKMSKIISDGYDKQYNNIKNSTENDGTIYELKINNKKLQSIQDNPNVSLETIKEASEMEGTNSKNGLQEGTDYIKMNNGKIALKTEKAFASTINMYNDAINDYNKSLEKYRNIENEYNNIAETYIKMPSGAEKEIKKGELEKKKDEMIAIKNKVKNHYNEALKHEETITRSITNNDLKNKASKAIDLEKLRRDTKYLRDNYFKECTGCGKQ